MLSIGKKTQSGCFLALNFPDVGGKFADFRGRALKCPGIPNFIELIAAFCSVSGGKKEYCRLISQITFSGGVKSLEVSKVMILELLNASSCQKEHLNSKDEAEVKELGLKK